MKLLTEYIWRLKQIFSHFGRQSLVEVVQTNIADEPDTDGLPHISFTPTRRLTAK